MVTGEAGAHVPWNDDGKTYRELAVVRVARDLASLSKGELMVGRVARVGAPIATPSLMVVQR